MAKAYRLTPSAEHDMAKHLTWYYGISQKLGDELVDLLEENFVFIAMHPLSNPLVYNNIRRKLVKKFPLIIYFKVDKGCSVITHIRHQHSDHANDIRHQP